MDKSCYSFRLWDPLNKSIKHFSLKNTENISQCVNLVDKNGTLIYENDIINTSVGPLLIRYCPECKQFQGMFVNSKGIFECLACDGDLQWCEIIEDYGKNIEILGNIYENPDFKDRWFN